MGRVERKEMRFPSSGAVEGGDRVAAGTSEQSLSRGRIAKQTDHWQQVKQEQPRGKKRRESLGFSAYFLKYLVILIEHSI